MFRFIEGWYNPPRCHSAPGYESRADFEAEYSSQWAAIESISQKFGYRTETLRRGVRQAERDSERREGRTTDGRERINELEPEDRELKRANEIQRKASAYSAQAELTRRRR